MNMNSISAVKPGSPPQLAGKRVTVIGLGREGVALVRFLASKGAQVTVSDQKAASQLAENLREIQGLPVTLSLGQNRVEDAVGADILFLSPGVPLWLPPVKAAKEGGVPISSLTQLFFQLCRAPIIGITGSSGKTTTTALIGEILKAAGSTVVVGGNIGLPLIEMVESIPPRAWVVLELSSFQLDVMAQSPQVSAITNVTPNHLDIHSSMEAYVSAKKNIFRFQGTEDVIILNYDDPVTRAMASECRGRVWYFSRDYALEEGAFVHNGWIKWRQDQHQTPIMPLCQIKLLGLHNRYNVLAASAVSTVCGVQPQVIAQTVAQFSGVEHRLELVRELDGVKYYNDSIATSPERSRAGVLSFQEPVILLAGGREKHLPLDAWGQAVHEHCVAIVLFGESAEALEWALHTEWKGQNRGPGAPPVFRLATLEEAVTLAQSLAQPGQVVLLSPACLSFDAFRNFEERGQVFKALVHQLRPMKD